MNFKIFVLTCVCAVLVFAPAASAQGGPRLDVVQVPDAFSTPVALVGSCSGTDAQAACPAPNDGALPNVFLQSSAGFDLRFAEDVTQVTAQLVGSSSAYPLTLTARTATLWTAAVPANLGTTRLEVRATAADGTSRLWAATLVIGQPSAPPSVPAPPVVPPAVDAPAVAPSIALAGPVRVKRTGVVRVLVTSNVATTVKLRGVARVGRRRVSYTRDLSVAANATRTVTVRLSAKKLATVMGKRKTAKLTMTATGAGTSVKTVITLTR